MKELRQILSSPYNQKDWVDFLKELFIAPNSSSDGGILSNPKKIHLSTNDKVKAAYELGSYYTSDKRLIGIYQVDISEDMLLYRNKVGLRNIMKNIYKYNVDGVLVVFVQEKKWRLSFISEIIKEIDEGGKAIKQITEEKRFTYLLGEGEKVKTPTDRLESLKERNLALNDFYEAFRVDILNDEFFKKYKKIYEDFVQYITGSRYEKKDNTYVEVKKHAPHPNFNGYQDYRDYPLPHPNRQTQAFIDKNFLNLFFGDTKAVRDFVKRMMGRIVFLYFIQKKGWLAVPKGKNWGEGNYDYLYQLYKETPKEDQPYFYKKRLVPLFFECFTNKKSEDKVNALRFPYLNGGLFDKSQDKAYDDIDMPYSIFEELFDTFDTYNFTVYEDAPNEHTVAVDPEMLGHIFENLLEDNKDKGAFYTPKEIVHYMCKESLRQFLISKIENDTNTEKVKRIIDKIIDHQVLTEDENVLLKTKGKVIFSYLEDVKICDPAIGSGAFPMGLLQEIYYIKIILQQLDVIKEQTDAEIKKHIIEKNIYGVDIESGAVDIARLRFWLSLVVDEQNPCPLPNLDFKIMQGNSLLESYQGMDLSNIGRDEEILIEEQMTMDFGDEYKTIQQLNIFSGVNKEKIQKLINEYFTATEDKNLKRKEINDLIEGKIHTQIYLEKNIVSSKVRKFLEKLNLESEKDLEEKIQRGKISTKGNEYKVYLANKKHLSELNAIEKELISFQAKIERPYFLWHTYFKDVFEKGGFDIVIGNPPYFSLATNSSEKDANGNIIKHNTIYDNQNYQTFARKGDIYCLFYEKAYQLLKQGGICNFITSNKWMRADYGESTRKFLLEKTNPIILIDFGGIKVFKTAKVDVNILLYVKEKSTFNTWACAVKDKELKKLSLYVRQHAKPTRFDNAESWVILSNIEQRIKAKIEAIGTPLKDWNIQINYGIKTGFNDAFIINGEKRAELIAKDPKSAEIIRPILRGCDIKRYSYEFNDRYLICTFPSLKIDIEQYPAVKGFLEGFKAKLKQTGEILSKSEINNIIGYAKNHNIDVKEKDLLTSRKKTKNKWFETQDSINYWEDFYKQVLAWQRITKENQFCLTEKGMVILDSMAFISGIEQYKYWLLALLNSRLIYAWVKWNVHEYGDTGFRLSNQYVQEIPIVPLDKDLEKTIITLLNEKQYHKIDTIIYKLYDLSDEEINFIKALKK